MELEILSFTVGMLAGGGFLGFGILVGMLTNRNVFTRQVKDQPFDPEAEVMDEAFFEEQWQGDGPPDDEFPSDEILEELDRLHRHSEL